MRGAHHDLKGVGAPRLLLVEVEVDDVAHLLPAAVHPPVVAVEREGPPQPAAQAGQGAEVVGAAAEAQERWRAALLHSKAHRSANIAM